MSQSANGRGRTLFERLTGANKKDARPLELQYHNPIGARVGSTVAFEQEQDISSINFVVEALSVYQTKIQAASFYHSDYHLKGISLEQTAPVKFRLRLIADENVPDQLGHRVQLLRLIAEKEFDEKFCNDVLGHAEGIISSSKVGNGYQFFIEDPDAPVEGSSKYWRVEDVLDPYNARVTILRDTDGNGTIEDDELEKREVIYWDYSRLTNDPLSGQELTEFLTVEMDKATKYFKFFCGKEVLPSQVAVF